MAKLLPLFPLQLVVFPRTQLPLHIFEERYKEMVGDAIENQSEFGIVLAKEDGVVNAGCTVLVDRVVTTYDDGRMDILTRGARRFEILLLNEEKAYLRGEVQFFDDEEEGPALRRAATGSAAALSWSAGVRRDARLFRPNSERPSIEFSIGAGGTGSGFSKRDAAESVRDGPAAATQHFSGAVCSSHEADK